MKEQVNYTEKTLPELRALAKAGDRDAAAEIIRRQAEIEQLKTVLGVKYRQKTNLKKIMKKTGIMVKYRQRINL